MKVTPKPVLHLIDEFSRLPGIGPKTASRLTFYLLRARPEQTTALADALKDLHEKVVLLSSGKLFAGSKIRHSFSFNTSSHSPIY